jgi:hypothetical protein
MPGMELIISACDDYIVVSLYGDLDITDAADVEAAIAAVVAPVSTWSSTRRRSISSIAVRLASC